MRIIFILVLLIVLCTSQNNTVPSDDNITVPSDDNITVPSGDKDKNTTNPDPKCETGILEGDICCHSTCNVCEICENNTWVNDLCCGENIRNQSLDCFETGPPCIYVADSTFTFSTERIIIISVTLTVIIILLIFVCCIFRKKKPPLEYAEIVGKFN